MSVHHRLQVQTESLTHQILDMVERLPKKQQLGKTTHMIISKEIFSEKTKILHGLFGRLKRDAGL